MPLSTSLNAVVFLLALLTANSNAVPSLQDIVDSATQEAKDILAKDEALTTQKMGRSAPEHTYVKFNQLTEFLAEKSNLNLQTYELLLQVGIDPEAALNALRQQRPEFCKQFLEPCSPFERFRRINGTCNNLNNPLWGSSYNGMNRILPARYSDGYNGQRGGDGVKVPLTLPNARLVSTTIHPDLIKPDVTITNMLPQFGQFVDHDISLAAEGDKRCCSGVSNVDCWPIQIYANDSFYSKFSERCMDFTRSTAFCFPTQTGVREQVNMLTSFVDASNVYGNEDERNSLVRSFQRGKLRTTAGNPNFPVTNDEIFESHGVKPMVMGKFLAGDDRINEMPGLLVMHTLWMREHNRIADGIYALMPFWSDEEIFQEARRLVIAQWQNVVYGEYLPVLLGPETMTKYGLTLRDWWSNYDPGTDPTVFHAFADAAYRFGHTFINGIIQLFIGMDNVGSYRIRDNFFVSDQVTQGGGLGYQYILDGLMRQNAQTYDPFVTEDLSNFVLRHPTEAFGADLIARNFQRGRDHGLPPYLEFRRLCGLPTASNAKWSDKPAEAIQDSWTKLSSLYESPEDIDLFSGGVCEIPNEGALTGPTFNCLKAMQFKRLKDGDRFFFTHGNQAGSFWEYQIQHIRRRTLGDIICDNSGVVQTQRNVFRTRAGSNIWVPCNSTERAKLDLTLFID